MLWQVILEGLAVCMILLICCVVGIANGAVNCVFLYDKKVQDRAVQNGLITPEKTAGAANDRHADRLSAHGGDSGCAYVADLQITVNFK